VDSPTSYLTIRDPTVTIPSPAPEAYARKRPA
jgi:hypothetical protein